MSQSFIWYGIAAYVVISIVVAMMSRAGKSTTMSDYFLGGRSMGGVVSALSYSATTYSAFMMVGLAGLTYKGGVGALGFEIVYFACCFAGGDLWSALLGGGQEIRLCHPSEMLGARYGSKWVALAAAVVSCVFLIPYSAVQLSGVGYLVSGMTEGGISFGVGLLIATVLAIFFSYVAGIRSVMWTDSLQALVMIVASVIVAILVVSELGGFSAMFATIAERKPEMLTVPGPGLFSLQTFIGLTIPWFFFSISNPQVSQRLFMPESLGALRRMLLIFLCFGLIYTLVSVIWGFSAFVAFPDLTSPDLATSVLLASDYVPPVLGVIVMVGILAAAVSTIDSILLTLSSMVARDVYGNVSRDQSDHRQLWVGKLVIPVISLLALGFAAMELSLISILSVAASAGLVVTVPAIVGAFFWKRGTAAGALVSIAGGGLFVIVMYLTGNKLFGYNAGILGLPVSTLLFVGVSLVTRPSKEVTEGFISEGTGSGAGRVVNAG